MRNANVRRFKTISYSWFIVVNVYFARLLLQNSRFQIRNLRGGQGEVRKGTREKEIEGENARFPPNLALSINLTSSSRRKEGPCMSGHGARFLARSHSRDTITIPGWTRVSPRGCPGHAGSSTTSTWVIRFLFLPPSGSLPALLGRL